MNTNYDAKTNDTKLTNKILSMWYQTNYATNKVPIMNWSINGLAKHGKDLKKISYICIHNRYKLSISTHI